MNSRQWLLADIAQTLASIDESLRVMTNRPSLDDELVDPITGKVTLKPKAKKGKKSSAARPDKEHAIKDRSGRTSDDIDPKEYDISSDEMWEE